MNAATIPLVSELLQERLQRRQQSTCPELWDLLEQIKDPEIPVISLWDLGILQDVVESQEDGVRVTITPTYSGCPAMREIEQDIYKLLSAAGYQRISVESRLAPAWSTDMMSIEGRQQLRDYGIAPPVSATSRQAVQCPQCGSTHTRKISEFGSTACKALYQCQECREPFDYFKCI